MIEVRRAADRFVTREAGRETCHSFSFGVHYDPANVAFGGLLCHNDDHVAPGHGYPDHPHRDVEIVTWVLSGALTHRDSSGTSGEVVPGRVQAMSAGSGVVHSETVAPSAGPTRFVQTWVRPDTPGLPPAYSSAEVSLAGQLVPVVSGSAPEALLRIGASGATLYAARLAPGSSVALPGDPLAHVFVATGALTLAEVELREADAARLTDSAGELLVASEPTELLVWGFARPL